MPKEFYTQQLEFYKSQAKKLSNQLTTIGWLRLIIFLVTGFGIYLSMPNWQLIGIIGFIGIGLFIYLLTVHTKKKTVLQLNRKLIEINEEELLIADRNYFHREKGDQFIDHSHVYSYDIDLFGRGSFFQYINRTVINEGTQFLAKLLCSNDVKGILERQIAIKELSENQKWQQHYSATGSIIKVETSAKSIVDWISDHKSTLPKFMKWLPWVFSMVSLVLLGLSIFGIVPIDFFGYWLFVGLAITGSYLKKISLLAHQTDKVKDTFRQYSVLLKQIEDSKFTSDLLKRKQKKIESEEEKASEIFSKFSKHLDALDNRNNLISAIFGNGYLLLDLKNAFRVEKWIDKYGHKVSDWFDAVIFFDAYNSLGTFAYNHQNYVFPEIVNSGTTIKATQLGHPLLDPAKRVSSDVLIKNQEFFIVTGANMAGKSTFLRTISLHVVMANVGLPLCAKTSSYSPVKLITSMRTSDSLTDDSSYFFSELSRLKFIVDHIDKEPYFIILDEILKGTNSTDKAIGSRKFVKKMVAGNATGIIATHDLSLCEIADELEEVENYYFDAEIKDDELYFDYTLKKGICRNMNASFLLNKMNIVD